MFTSMLINSTYGIYRRIIKKSNTDFYFMYYEKLNRQLIEKYIDIFF